MHSLIVYLKAVSPEIVFTQTTKIDSSASIYIFFLHVNKHIYAKAMQEKKCYQFESGQSDGVRHEKYWREGI